MGLFDERTFHFYGHGVLKGDSIEFVDMNKPCESDAHYIDLSDSLPTRLSEHMYLLSYQELCFDRTNFDSFKMEVSPSLTLGPFEYGLEVHSLSVKMTSVMEEEDEDQMEDETELVRVFNGKHHIGRTIRSVSVGLTVDTRSASPPTGKGSSNSRLKSHSDAGAS